MPILTNSHNLKNEVATKLAIESLAKHVKVLAEKYPLEINQLLHAQILAQVDSFCRDIGLAKNVTI